jgi:cystinosin
VTFVKYIPQVILNFKNKSTHGWSIGQIQFDLSGSILSLSQLILDASLQNDWSGILGNPTKLGLAVVSMSFDFIFITQHFILYRGSREPESDKLRSDPADSQQPLLDE